MSHSSHRPAAILTNLLRRSPGVKPARNATALRRMQLACQIEGLEPRVLMSRVHHVGETPLVVPSAVKATLPAPTSIQVKWSDKDANALGYNVLRSINGSAFTQVATLNSPKTTTFTDNNVSFSSTYRYEIEAFSAAKTSAPSGVATIMTSVAAPSALTAVIQSATKVQLNWTNNDPAATGYVVLRSIDNKGFSKIAQLSSAAVTTYTDATTLAGHKYRYEIQALRGSSVSAVSNIAAASTPLAAPSDLTATSLSSTSIQLSWTNHDSAAAGIIVLRSTDGGEFSQIGKTTFASTASFTDTAVQPQHAYFYEVQAYNGGSASPVSATAAASTSFAAPTNLAAIASNSTSIELTWTNNDDFTAGYFVLRSTNGSAFTQIAQIGLAGITTYADTTVTASATYTYQVQAFHGGATSAASNVASATTSMIAPSGLSASLAGGSVLLGWTDKDSSANGYFVLRSTDGASFTQIAQLKTGSANSYTDTTAASGQKYYYEVKAYNGIQTSPASNVASVTIPASNGGGVTIATRFGKELTITATGANDSISISQSGSTLTIMADGQTYTSAVPTGGLFIYTRGGSDGVVIDSTVSVRTTIEAVDGATTIINSAGSNVSIWDDSTDTFTGAGILHSISSFAGGVTKALGASLADPKDAGAITHINMSLWGTGPKAADVNQGSVGDCYFLASLAGFAGEKPSVLLESAVDMGDGTYTVQFFSQNKPVFIRVSNDMSTGYFAGFNFAHPGANGTAWAMVLEKAFCYFRTGANTYASINSGWMGEVYSDLGVSSSNFTPSNYSESAFYAAMSTALANGKAVTLGTSNAPNLVSGHAYTLVSASIDSNGVTHYVVRNPWGVSGDAMEDANGYATLTFAQMKANFIGGVLATA